MDYDLARQGLMNRARYLDHGYGGAHYPGDIVEYLGGRFKKGVPLDYETYLKMWKTKHPSAKGAKAAYARLHKTKTAPKKKTAAKKNTTKRAKSVKPKTKKKASQSPWIKFIKAHRGKGYSFTELSEMYHNKK